VRTYFFGNSLRHGRLVPAIHVLLHFMNGGRLGLLHDEWAHGILYAGVTSGLPKRAYEHREGLVDGFTKQHGLNGWCTTNGMTPFSPPSSARRTSSIGRAAWKVRLIHSMNPNWDDLYDTLI